MTDKVRQEMGEYAVAAAQSVNYVGAGTIEFLVDNDLNYYFLEMNTRLQVEHPITERVIGVDLVKEQIRIAEGETLSMKQDDVVQKGHAIECRIYAEDPDNNFMPSPGKIQHLTEPLGLGVRQDGYVYEGFEIPIYYDPMISKLIVWGKNRTEAIQRMRRALYEYKITGIKTSIKFLERIMETPEFVNGNYDTGFIEKNEAFLFEKRNCDNRCLDISMIVALIDYQNRLNSNPSNKNSSNEESEWRKSGKKTSMNRF